ncbi:MAG: hypothetical protein HQP61_07910 [Peptococcaceae bacterium]|nr:hypothetical protein [Candidatus Syntrophopropionicum ammoniitolerans]
MDKQKLVLHPIQLREVITEKIRLFKWLKKRDFDKEISIIDEAIERFMVEGMNLNPVYIVELKNRRFDVIALKQCTKEIIKKETKLEGDFNLCTVCPLTY